MKQKRRQKMWQEFKVLILASVGLKRHKKGSKEIKRYSFICFCIISKNVHFFIIVHKNSKFSMNVVVVTLKNALAFSRILISIF